MNKSLLRCSIVGNFFKITQAKCSSFNAPFAPRFALGPLRHGDLILGAKSEIKQRKRDKKLSSFPVLCVSAKVLFRYLGKNFSFRRCRRRQIFVGFIRTQNAPKTAEKFCTFSSFSLMDF